MTARVQRIRFDASRRPSPKKIRIGYETDNMAERLVFILPMLAQDQSAFFMRSGDDANIGIIKREGDQWYIDMDVDLIGAEGVVPCHVRIDTPAGEVWNSDPFQMIVGDVGDVEMDVEKKYPSAVGEMLGAIAEHRAEMDKLNERLDGVDEDVESANSSAETAVNSANAAISAASASGTSAESAAEAAVIAVERADEAVNKAASAEAAANTATTNAQTAVNAAESAAAAAAEANEVLESIPEDYKELSGKVGKLSEEIDSETTARNAAIAQERNRAVTRENELEALFTAPTQDAVDKWLDEHPEATTTVQDGSLEVEKFTDDAKLHIVKDYVTPEMYMDDEKTFAEALNIALDRHPNVLIPAGEYYVENTINIPKNTTLCGSGSGNTTLIFSTNANCIMLENNASLEDVKIETAMADYSGTVIDIHETDEMKTNVRVSNVVIRHSFATRRGTGIALTSMGDTILHGIGYCVFENVTIWNMEYGIYIKDNQHNKGGWVNSIRAAHCSFVGCSVGICIDSPSSAGHIFDFIYQSDEYTRYAIECRGRENIFRCYCWDIKDFKNAKLAHFTHESSFNQLQLGNNPSFMNLVIDNGFRNDIPRFDSIGANVPTADNICQLSDTINGGITPYSTTLIGDQNNCLAFADKIAIISSTGFDADEAKYNFSVGDIFNPFKRSKVTLPRYKNGAGSITIDYGTSDKAIIKLARIGVVFGNGHIAKTVRVKIVYCNTPVPNDATQWTESKEYAVENNTNSVVEFDLVKLLSNGNVPTVKYITLSFADALEDAGYNPYKFISISNIYGVQNSKNNNTPFLARCGGHIHGDVVFEEGGVVLTSPNGAQFKLFVTDDGTLTISPHAN